MACAVEYNLRKFSLGETKAGPGRLGYGLTCQVNLTRVDLPGIYFTTWRGFTCKVYTLPSDTGRTCQVYILPSDTGWPARYIFYPLIQVHVPGKHFTIWYRLTCQVNILPSDTGRPAKEALNCQVFILPPDIRW